jgi:multiple sugar transport system permease protein
MGILGGIVLLLVVPGVITVVVCAFLVSWQEYVYGVTLANSEAIRPVSPGIGVTFPGMMSLQWEEMMATVPALVVPVVVLYVFLQRYVIAGLTAGAVKE